MTPLVRIAAAGDIHASEAHRRRLTQAFEDVAGRADLVLLAGDLTTFGLPEEASVLAEASRAAAPLPVVAVLGNHDYHSAQAAEVASALAEGGIIVLERSHLILDLDSVEVGFPAPSGAGREGDRASWVPVPLR